jgi:uncharacterized protein (TIGR03067 family)
MQSKLLSLLAFVVVLAFAVGAAPLAPDDRASLQGVWIAQSIERDGKPIEIDGKPANADAGSQMRFTFDGDKLLFGGRKDGREDRGNYTIDARKSPKWLDITMPNHDGLLLGIYEIKGDELKVCVRHEHSPGGRPAEFSTKPGSELFLYVFKKAKAASKPK